MHVHVHVAPVRDVDVPGVHAEQRAIPRRSRIPHARTDVDALHVRGPLHIEVCEQGRRDVDGLRQDVGALSGPGIARVPQEERRVDELVVPGQERLGPPAVLAQQVSVIGVDDQQGVVPQAVLVHRVEHASEGVVAHRNERGVLAAGRGDLGVALGDLRVRRPVEVRIVLALRPRIAVAVGVVGEERLVRIEQFELQHPPVRSGVRLDEVDAGVHRERLRVKVLRRLVAAVDGVLRLHRPVGIGVVARSDDAFPGVTLLSAEVLPRGVARVIRCPAVLPVVGVVRGEVRVHAGLTQQLGHRVVERLERAPIAMQEVVAARVHLPAGGHAGHGAGVEPLEGERALGEPSEIGSIDDAVGIRRDHVPVQAVEHQDDGAHSYPRFAVAWVRIGRTTHGEPVPGSVDPSFVNLALKSACCRHNYRHILICVIPSAGSAAATMIGIARRPTIS